MEEGHTGLEAEMFARQAGFSSLLGTVDLTVWHHLSTICLLDVTACDGSLIPSLSYLHTESDQILKLGN